MSRLPKRAGHSKAFQVSWRTIRGITLKTLNIPPGAAEVVDANKLQGLVNDILSTRAQLRELESRLRQAGIE